jgi:hypothetical protein
MRRKRITSGLLMLSQVNAQSAPHKISPPSATVKRADTSGT